LYFSQYAIGIFGEGAERLGLITLLFGLFLHFLAAAVFGIVYAVLAARFKPMWSAPTSVLSGIVYGLVMYFVAEDVTVPVLHVISYTPAWEALVGNVLFHGLVLSEYITISHRRNVAAIA
jgi:uncharacterized membrane protein YagU involved in acid resistance